MSRIWKVGVRSLGFVLALAGVVYAGGTSSMFFAPSLQGVDATAESLGSGTAGDPATTSPYGDDEILVRFKTEIPQSAIASVHALVGATAVKSFTVVKNLQLVRLPRGVSVKEAIEFYRKDPDVLYAEPNFIVEALTAPNDPSFGFLWGLYNVGQDGGTPDASINAPGAWDITTGSNNVVVAVIDTGIDYNHQDLSANMFRNIADCNSNGVDDDGNGYIDDCYGIDTANGDSDPMDDYSHGTHVAGTIGAVGNNDIGVVGVNWRVSIMACKFLGANGSGYISDAVACLEYVKTMKERGINIIATNNSWGGGGFSQALHDAIDAHRQRGILFIAAAGNNTSDNDATPFYPASYYLPNIITVAATDRTDALAFFSNYGRRTAHVGAPGHQILSTVIGNLYETYSGTSMATPHVTGLAALLKAQNPSLDWRTIKNLILAGGDNLTSLTNTITQKRLNAHGALTCSGSTVLSRLRPISTTIPGSVGTPVDLSALHINCATPNGNVPVTVDPGGQIVTLLDDGLGFDQAAGDGIYSGQWTPSAVGTYTLTFPDGDVVTAQVLSNYHYSPTPFSWRTITGTSLNFSDESSAQIASPFPILFGGGSFTDLFVSSNGHLNLTGPFTNYTNQPIPTSEANTLVAPFWDDLYPAPETNQNVFWAVTGTAPNRELVIEWRDVRHYLCNADSSATVKFQVVFFEGSSNILFNYADTLFGGGCTFADRGGSATVGVQTASDNGSQFSSEAPSLNDNTALQWALAGSIDLVVPALSAPTKAGAGSTITATDTTKNQGANLVGPSTTEVYLSSNTILDAGDTLLGSRAVPAMAPGAANSGSLSVTIPLGTPTGTWYLIAKADADNSVPEAIESNNTKARAIAIKRPRRSRPINGGEWGLGLQGHTP